MFFLLILSLFSLIGKLWFIAFFFSQLCVVLSWFSYACSIMSCFLQLYRLRLIRLLCPWNFPGKNTGVGCHFLLNPHMEPTYLLSLVLYVNSLPLSHKGSSDYLHFLSFLILWQKSIYLFRCWVSFIPINIFFFFFNTESSMETICCC